MLVLRICSIIVSKVRQQIVKPIGFSVLCVTAAMSAALQASPVWKISDGDSYLFLAGTIHMLSRSDYPLPAQFDSAYQLAEEVFFEVDLQAGQAKVMAALGRNMLWPLGETLKQKVSPETWRTFEGWCKSRGLAAVSFNSYKPGALIMTLLPVELMRHGVGMEGVDRHYAQRADTDGKEIGELETIEQQLAMISALGVGAEDDFLRYFVRDMDNLGEQFDQLRGAWRSGDNALLAQASDLTRMREQSPQVYQMLLVTRNNAWLPKIIAMLESPQVELVLVGALHLVGPDGLLKRLETAGYELQQLR